MRAAFRILSLAVIVCTCSAHKLAMHHDSIHSVVNTIDIALDRGYARFVRGHRHSCRTVMDSIVADGRELLGQTNRTLTLNAVQSADEGDYTVMVTNVAGAAVSDAARLYVVRCDHLIAISSSH